MSFNFQVTTPGETTLYGSLDCAYSLRKTHLRDTRLEAGGSAGRCLQESRPRALTSVGE